MGFAFLKCGVTTKAPEKVWFLLKPKAQKSYKKRAFVLIGILLDLVKIVKGGSIFCFIGLALEPNKTFSQYIHYTFTHIYT